ncbi:MAG: DoxX family protein [Campylobacteraceae bacterium]|nr:DoxX family protein [Campylobacteraceae bacterium]
MSSSVQVDLGKFVLRFGVGFLMLFHGIAKLVKGVDFIKMTLAKSDLPEFLAYGTYIGEIVALILILIGLKTRSAAGVIIFTMLAAIYLVHPGDIFSLTKTGAWAIELIAFYIFACSAIILLGPGKYSVDKN